MLKCGVNDRPLEKYRRKSSHGEGKSEQGEFSLKDLQVLKGAVFALVQLPEALALIFLKRGRCPLVELFHLKVRHDC